MMERQRPQRAGHDRDLALEQQPVEDQAARLFLGAGRGGAHPEVAADVRAAVRERQGIEVARDHPPGARDRWPGCGDDREPRRGGNAQDMRRVAEVLGIARIVEQHDQPARARARRSVPAQDRLGERGDHHPAL